MATSTDSQEPELVQGSLSFRSEDVDFSLRAANDSIYHDGIINLKVFIREFALCNYSNIRSISKDVITMAAAEFAHQRFGNHPIYLRKILESSFKNQLTSEDSQATLETLQEWVTFTKRSTPLVDVLGLWLKKTSKGRPIKMKDNEFVFDDIQASTVKEFPPLEIVALQSGQLSQLVNDNRSVHIQLSSKQRDSRTGVSHVHLERESSSRPGWYLVHAKPAFDLSLIVSFKTRVYRDIAMRKLQNTSFIPSKQGDRPVDVVLLGNDDRSRQASMVLHADARCALFDTLETFLKEFGRIPETMLARGSNQNGVTGQCITLSTDGFDLQHRWLLKVMTLCKQSRTFEVDVRPESACLLCHNPIRNPRVISRATATSIASMSAATADTCPSLIDSANSDLPPKILGDPLASKSSVGQVNEISENVGGASVPATTDPISIYSALDPEKKAISEGTDPPFGTTPRAATAPPSHTTPPTNTVLFAGPSRPSSCAPRNRTPKGRSVPKWEKERRKAVGLCVRCGEKEHMKGDEPDECPNPWTFQPNNVSTFNPELPGQPAKRSISGDGHSSGSNKRGRGGFGSKSRGFGSR